MGKVISAIPQIPAFPLSPFVTGKQAVDMGESAGTAQKAALIDTVGNLAGVALPGWLGGGVAKRFVTGAGINAAQDVTTRKAIQEVVQTPEAKEAMGPSLESAALSGVIGGGFAATLGRTSGKSRLPKDVQLPSKSPIAAAVAAEKQSKAPTSVPNRLDINLEEGPGMPDVMRVTPEGQAYAHDNGAEAGYSLMQKHQQLADVARQIEEARLAEQQKQADAQSSIEARNKQIELDVARQTGLDINAAERARQLRAPVPGLEESRMREINDSIARTQDLNTRGQQMDIVEDYGNNDPMTRMPNMRIDENGIPIRADLSMEAQNLQNPLQRNLWGDELPNLTGDESIPLTQALDSMPKGPSREQAVNSLGKGMGRGQRGAIDMEFLDAVAKKGKDALQKLRNTAWNKFWDNGKDYDGEEYQDIKAIDQKIYELEKRDRIAAGMAVNSPKEVFPGYTHIPSGTKVKATHGLMYKEPTMATVVGTKDMRFEDGPYRLPVVDFGDGRPRTLLPSDVKEVFGGPRRLGKESGVIDIQAVKEAWDRFRERWPVKDSEQTPVSPETIAAKQVKVNKAKAVGAALGEWADPATPEEALHLASEAKDIKATRVGKQVAPGNNFMAAYHNNPVLKYVRKLVNDARGEATTASRQFLTGPDGVSTLITKLRPEERVRVAELVGELDKQQVDYSPELADKIGLSPTERKFMESYTKLTEKLWEWGSTVKDSQGLSIGPKRRGYAASVFRGDYNALVTKDGKVIGVIAVDTPGEFKLAKEYYEKSNPGAKFSADTYQKARRNIQGTTQSRAFRYNDLGAMIDLLKNADGDLSKAQLEIDKQILKATTDLYGLNVHDLAKKGVSGNQGNKPWLDRATNAQQRLDAIVRNSEDRFEYLSLQKPNEIISNMMPDPRLDHLPNTKDYLKDYWSNVTGSYLNKAGVIGNNLFDLATSYSEKMGVSPTKAIEYSNILKNKMSQLYMGWGNMAFLFSQWMQPFQTGYPMLQLAAGRLGLGQADVNSAMVKAMGQWLRASINNMDVVNLGVDERTKSILAWAENRGIMDFSELERVYEGHKSDVGRTMDHIAEWNMQFGESSTRPPMFLAFVNLLSKSEPDLNKVLPIAENLTNQAMVDYHKWERPLMYTGAGVLGPHVGGLTTFKHSYLGTQTLLAKELKKNPKPFIASAMAMTFLAGVTGVPFYDEADTLYQELKQLAGMEPGSIAQDALQDLPQWMKTGVLSSALDLNIQGKFSSANMVPDSVGQAVFPHLSGAAKIMGSAADFASNPNENTFGNLAVQSVPSGFKQAATEAFKQNDGYTVGKDGQNEYYRTPEQWTKSSVTGLVPQQEAVDKQRMYQGDRNAKQLNDQMKNLSSKFKDAVIRWDVDAIPDIVDEYAALGGDPNTLLNQIDEIRNDAQLSREDRTLKPPKNPKDIQRMEGYR